MVVYTMENCLCVLKISSANKFYADESKLMQTIHRINPSMKNYNSISTLEYISIYFLSNAISKATSLTQWSYSSIVIHMHTLVTSLFNASCMKCNENKSTAKPQISKQIPIRIGYTSKCIDFTDVFICLCTFIK